MAVQRASQSALKPVRDAALASGMDQGMEAGYTNLDVFLLDQRNTDEHYATSSTTGVPQ
jgi:hypothetical protein